MFSGYAQEPLGASLLSILVKAKAGSWKLCVSGVALNGSERRVTTKYAAVYDGKSVIESCDKRGLSWLNSYGTTTHNNEVRSTETAIVLVSTKNNLFWLVSI